MRTYRSAITWTSTSETASERVFLLKTPLRDAEPAKDQAVYTAQSLDRSVIETFAVSSGAHELTGTVRYADDPQGLLDMIDAGARNVNLTYIPELNDPDTAYTCRLVSPRGALQVGPDPDAGQLGEHAVEVRLRKTDQTPFQAAYSGTDVLFAYDAGGDLSQATFSRTSGAYTVGSGFGQLSTVAANVARTAWFSTASSQGPRLIPVTLLEDTRTNLVTAPEDFNDASWTVTANKTSNQTDPAGGTNAFKLADDSTTATESAVTTFAVTSTGTYTASIFLAHDGSTRSNLTFDTSGSTTKHVLVFNWTSGVPDTITSQSGTGTVFGPERYDENFYRIGWSLAIPATDTYRLTVYPVAGSNDATGAVYAYGAQVE